MADNSTRKIKDLNECISLIQVALQYLKSLAGDPDATDTEGVTYAQRETDLSALIDDRLSQIGGDDGWYWVPIAWADETAATILRLMALPNAESQIGQTLARLVPFRTFLDGSFFDSLELEPSDTTGAHASGGKRPLFPLPFYADFANVSQFRADLGVAVKCCAELGERVVLERKSQTAKEINHREFGALLERILELMPKADADSQAFSLTSEHLAPLSGLTVFGRHLDAVFGHYLSENENGSIVEARARCWTTLQMDGRLASFRLLAQKITPGGAGGLGRTLFSLGTETLHGPTHGGAAKLFPDDIPENPQPGNVDAGDDETTTDESN